MRECATLPLGQILFRYLGIKGNEKGLSSCIQFAQKRIKLQPRAIFDQCKNVIDSGAVLSLGWAFQTNYRNIKLMMNIQQTSELLVINAVVNCSEDVLFGRNPIYGT